MILSLLMAVFGGVGGSPFDWDGSTSYTSVTIDPGTTNCSITFATDGSGSETAVSGTFNGWWKTYPDTGIGTGKYVRAVKTSGDDLNYGGLTQGVWYEISSARSFGTTQSGLGNTTWVGTFEFGFDGSNAAYTSPTVTIDATVT